MGASKAQLDANARWKAKHKEKQKKYQYKSYARSYIKKFANEQDLEELEELIKEKRNSIE